MMGEWTDLMTDLESMGGPPDGAIVSIGACFFDVGTRTIGPTFNQAIHLATAVRDGGQMDPSTVLFWLAQSDAARQAIMWSTRDNRRVLADFTDFINEHSTVKTLRPWGNSTTFDMVLLKGAYRRIGEEEPWRFYNERDFRTVHNMYPSVKYDPKDKGDDAHNALADAVFQAKHLFKIKDKYGRPVQAQET